MNYYLTISTVTFLYLSLFKETNQCHEWSFIDTLFNRFYQFYFFSSGKLLRKIIWNWNWSITIDLLTVKIVNIDVNLTTENHYFIFAYEVHPLDQRILINHISSLRIQFPIRIYTVHTPVGMKWISMLRSSYVLLVCSFYSEKSESFNAFELDWA